MDTEYAVAPGEFLEEWLEDQGMSRAEVARRLGVSPQWVASFIAGSASVTSGMASSLSAVTRINAEFWSRMQRLYRDDLARLGRSL